MSATRVWTLRLAFLIAATLVVGACAPTAAPPSPAASAPTAAPKAAAATPTVASKPKEPLKLKLASPQPGTPEAGLAAIAQAMGYFKDEGLEVEFVFTQGGGDTAQAVQIPGGPDVGMLTGPMSVLGAIEKGADLKIIAAGTTPADQRWITTKDSPYKTIKDLEGKPIGFTSAGSSTNLFALGILEKEGVKAELVPSGTMGGNMWTKLKTGQLAAAPSQPPDVWERLEAEGARQLFAVKDYPDFNSYTYVVHFARSDSIKTKPEAIKAFFRGWQRAAELVRKDPATATKAYMPNTELAEPLVLRYFKEIPATKFDLKPIGGMDITIKYAKQFKFITKDPDLNQVVDLSLVP